MGTVTKQIKVGAVVSWIITSRILFFTITGALCNWIFFITKIIGVTKYAFHPWTWGGTGLFLLYLVLFLVGFPIAYFFISKGYAILKAIEYVYTENKPAFYEFLTERFINSYEVGGTGKTMMEKSDKLNTWIAKQPWALAWMYRFLLEIVPLVPAFVETANEIPINKANTEQISAKLAQKLDKNIQEQVIDAHKIWVWGLIAINVLLATIYSNYWAS